MKVLVVGWFSFEQMGATAGDLMARDVVCGWLDAAGVARDLAVAPPFVGGVDWTQADPHDYSHVVFVCGPFGNGAPLTGFIERFRECALIGIDVSMLQPLDEWNPFTCLIERDSSRRSHPDLAFLAQVPPAPVVGLCLVHPQPEYKNRGRHADVNDALERLLARHDVAVVRIDTRLDANTSGLRTVSQIESLIARTDMVVTTRLHGLVLAIKNGVPALAVDPIVGGAKVSTQAGVIGWPVVFPADELSDAALDRAFLYCLSQEARATAARSTQTAKARLEHARHEFLGAIVAPS